METKRKQGCVWRVESLYGYARTSFLTDEKAAAKKRIDRWGGRGLFVGLFDALHSFDMCLLQLVTTDVPTLYSTMVNIVLCKLLESSHEQKLSTLGTPRLALL